MKPGPEAAGKSRIGSEKTKTHQLLPDETSPGGVEVFYL